MTLHDCIADYLRFLRYEQGAAPTTIKAYQARLHNFQNWLTENGYPNATLDAFNVPTLRRFLYHLGGKGLRPRTIRGFFNPIRSLGAFLVANEALTENPAVKVGLPKKDAALRETVSEEEIRQLLDACERRRNPQQIALARALFSVLIFAGVRRSECLDLKLDDVNLSDGSLLVRNGKGNKSRRVFLCADACSALREWLVLRPKDCTHSYIFAFDRNRRIHHDGLRTLLEEIKAIAGLAGHENIKPHSLRHAAATRLLRNGADIRSIQSFLGHTNLQTTAVYLHSDEERQRDIRELSALPDMPTRQDDGKILRLPERIEQQQERPRLRRRAV